MEEVVFGTDSGPECLNCGTPAGYGIYTYRITNEGKFHDTYQAKCHVCGDVVGFLGPDKLVATIKDIKRCHEETVAVMKEYD